MIYIICTLIVVFGGVCWRAMKMVERLELDEPDNSGSLIDEKKLKHSTIREELKHINALEGEARQSELGGYLNDAADKRKLADQARKRIKELDKL